MRPASSRAKLADETPDAAISALIEARGLHAHYGESHVLRGVSLSIGAGESIGLLGRNGMGKTTLIRALLGLTPASAGKVLVHGRDCTSDPPYRIARLGIGLRARRTWHLSRT